MSQTSDIVDRLRAVLEPSGAAIGSPTIVELDDTLAEPSKYEVADGSAGKLWAWPLNEELQETGDGSLDQQNFHIRVVFAADRRDEVDAGVRYRAVSMSIDARAEAYGDTIRGNRTLRPTGGGTSLVDDIHVERIDWQFLRGFDGRGFAMDLAGYRQLSN